jgi:uncharacterized membrane protein YccC
LGAIVGLLATMVVSDEELRQRKTTTLLFLAPAALSAALGALLSSIAWLQGLVLLVFVFLALYLRRFGPRYVVLGMVALIPLFLSSFVGYGVGLLPWVLLSAAIGILCAYAFRFFLLPDRPEGALRRGVAPFDIQLDLTLDAVADTVEDCRDDEKRRKRLRREAERHNERATATEGLHLADDAQVARERSERLRLYLFAAEMSANTLSEVAWRYAASEHVPPDVRGSLLRALRESRAALPKGGDLPDDAEEVSRALEELRRSREKAEDEDATGWSFQARQAEAVLRQLSEAAEEGYERVPAIRNRPNPGRRTRKRGGPGPSAKGWHRGEATPDPGAGHLGCVGRRPWPSGGTGGLSEPAVLGRHHAFVVFMGSGTLGNAISRGVQRMIGTLLGAVAGLLLASLASGNLYLEVPLAVACVFLASTCSPSRRRSWCSGSPSCSRWSST